MASGSKFRPWRRDSEPSPGNDLTAATELDLINVTLLTEVGGTEAEVPGLGLGFDSTGMSVRKPDGATFVKIPWSSITGLTTGAMNTSRHSLSTAAALEVHGEHKRHRFQVPNVQAEALAGSLGAISSRYGGLQIAGGKVPRH